MPWIISVALTMQIILKELTLSSLILLLLCLPYQSLQRKIRKCDKEEEDEEQDEEEEEEGEEPPSHLNVLWDEDDFRDEVEDDIMEEACIGNDYNLQSKGALKKDDKLSTSNTSKKNAPSKQLSTDKAPQKEKEKEKEKEKVKEKEITPEIVKEKEVTPS